MRGLEVMFSVSEAIVGVCALCGSRVYANEDYKINDNFDPICEGCASEDEE